MQWLLCSYHYYCRTNCTHQYPVVTKGDLLTSLIRHNVLGRSIPIHSVPHCFILGRWYIHDKYISKKLVRKICGLTQSWRIVFMMTGGGSLSIQQRPVEIHLFKVGTHIVGRGWGLHHQGQGWIHVTWHPILPHPFNALDAYRPSKLPPRKGCSNISATFSPPLSVRWQSKIFHTSLKKFLLYCKCCDWIHQ